MARLPKIALLAAAAAVLALVGPQAASAATCGGTTGSTYSNAVTATAGLVSYWRLGEPSGTSACDSWGSNAGSYQGGYIFVPGPARFLIRRGSYRRAHFIFRNLVHWL